MQQMAENLGLLNPYLVTGIGNTGAYTQPSQVKIDNYCKLNLISLELNNLMMHNLSTPPEKNIVVFNKKSKPR